MDKETFFNNLKKDLEVLKSRTIVESEAYEIKMCNFHKERYASLRSQLETLREALYKQYGVSLNRLVACEERKNPMDIKGDFKEYISVQKQEQQYSYISGIYSGAFDLEKNINRAKKSIEQRFIDVFPKIEKEMQKKGFECKNIKYTSKLVGSSDCEILIEEAGKQVYCRYVEAGGEIQRYHHRFIVTGKKPK